MTKIIRYLLLPLIAGLLLTGCGDSTPTASVSSAQLYADYRANEIAADSKYKGHVLEISGYVTAVGNDITDSSYVELNGDRDGMFGVQCFFRDKSQLTSLNKGQQVRLKGKCDGLMGNVLIQKCEFE